MATREQRAGAGGGRRVARRPLASSSAVALVGLGIFVYAGCRTPAPPRLPASQPIRISEALEAGDAARRASLGLVVQGLDADRQRAWRSAEGSYQRAIQVDPTNPYAYLALARHSLDAGDPALALNLIDQSSALFDAEGLGSDAVRIHLIGLRGWALESTAYPGDGVLYLERAARLAPTVWGDAYLSPGELQ